MDPNSQYFLKEGESVNHGQYVIDAVLGQGAFARVYKALKVDSQQCVAIKQVLRSVMDKTPKLIELYKSEVAILKTVKNEHVIGYIDHFQTQTSAFLVMEFCDSGNLEETLNVYKRFPEATVIEYFKQILDGFKALHFFKVVHRDLKAQNILVHQGILKIADFGFAKELSQSTQSMLGTPATTAPEIMRGAKYGFEVDVYSLGVVLYHMLFGEYPYNAVKDSWQDIVKKKQIVYEKPGINISPEMKDLLQRMICFSRNERIKWFEIYEHPILAKDYFNRSVLQISFQPSNDAKILYQKYKNLYIDDSSQSTDQTGGCAIQPELPSYPENSKTTLEDSKDYTQAGQNQAVSRAMDVCKYELNVKQFENIKNFSFCFQQVGNQIFNILRLSMQLPKESRSRLLVFLLSKKANSLFLNIKAIITNSQKFFTQSQHQDFQKLPDFGALKESAQQEGQRFEKLLIAAKQEIINEIPTFTQHQTTNILPYLQVELSTDMTGSCFQDLFKLTLLNYFENGETFLKSCTTEELKKIFFLRAIKAMDMYDQQGNFSNLHYDFDEYNKGLNDNTLAILVRLYQSQLKVLSISDRR